MRTTVHHFWTKASDKVVGKSVSLGARLLYRRPFQAATPVPIISFTFDDFPRSALLDGGIILKRYGVTATYYASFGLMGKEASSGAMFLAEDLPTLLEQGHELGCHTFGHCHSWKAEPAAFEQSIIENRLALGKILPGVSFSTFAYPFSEPRPGTKRVAGKYFLCCRGGGFTLNSGIADLNLLRAFFLEKSRETPDVVTNLIDRNRRERGWLIFATHDISETPSPYGCTPSFFENIVRYAIGSGAEILTVARACQMLRDSSVALPQQGRPRLAGMGDRKQ